MGAATPRYRCTAVVMGLLFTALLLMDALVGGVATASAANIAPVEAIRERLVHPTPGDVITIAHRSCWKETAENSLAGVRRCIAMGVDGVEFDVRHTKDGVAVVMHDETVDRTTNGHGPVSSLSYAEIQRLHLRAGAGGPNAPLSAERVPTLTQYLGAAKGRLLLVFDVKDWSQVESFAAARSAGVDRQAIFFYECRNHELLDKLRGFWDQVLVFPIAFESDGPLAASMANCRSNPAGMIHTKWLHDGFLEAAARESKARNERLWIATMFPEDVAGHSDREALADPQSAWGREIAAGANMIMTNQPAALLAYLRQRASASAR